MNGLSQALEQGRHFAEQHVPAEALSQTVPVAIIVLGAGVIISVLGARLARPALTVAFGIGGAIAAGQFAQRLSIPIPVTILLAAVLVGGLGFWLHRLWIGIVVALVASSLALSVFGYYKVLPELEAFQDSPVSAISGPDGQGFTLPEPEEQLTYNQRSPETWARDFWAHLTSRQADVDKKIAFIGAGGALLGLLIGVVATRGALIVCTALIGTSLVASGLTVLASNAAPQAYANALERPALLGGAWIGLLIFSLAIQTLLTRRPPKPVKAPADR